MNNIIAAIYLFTIWVYLRTMEVNMLVMEPFRINLWCNVNKMRMMSEAYKDQKLCRLWNMWMRTWSKQTTNMFWRKYIIGIHVVICLMAHEEETLVRNLNLVWLLSNEIELGKMANGLIGWVNTNLRVIPSGREILGNATIASKGDWWES